MTNTDLDPGEIPTTTTTDTGELGRSFTFRGITLKPYSFHHVMAYWRITATDGVALKFENAVILLFVLTLDAKDVNAIRSAEEQNALRFAAIEWAGKLGMGRGTFNADAIAKAREIEEDLDKANAVGPKGDGTPRPNA